MAKMRKEDETGRALLGREWWTGLRKIGERVSHWQFMRYTRWGTCVRERMQNGGPRGKRGSVLTVSPVGTTRRTGAGRRRASAGGAARRPECAAAADAEDVTAAGGKPLCIDGEERRLPVRYARTVCSSWRKSHTRVYDASRLLLSVKLEREHRRRTAEMRATRRGADSAVKAKGEG